MKKFLLLTYLCGAVFLQAPSQVVPKQQCTPVENVQTTSTTQGVKVSWNYPEEIILAESFNAGTLPTGWTTIDADGDGYNWDATTGFAGYNGGRCISSSSYLPNLSLYPDNYLISPLAEGAGTVEYWVSNQDEPAMEHYAVCASSTGTDAGDFSIVFEETAYSKSATTKEQGKWYKKNILLPEGTKYVAFRHFDSGDQYWLNIDQVVIKNELATTTNKANKTNLEVPEQDLIGYRVYRDNTLISVIEDITTLEYIDASGNEKEDKTYCVKAIYNICESDPVCSTITSVTETSSETTSVYPNPVTDFLHIRIANTNQPISITLHDIAGRMIQKSRVTDGKINLSALSAGVYNLSIERNGITVNKKIVKR